MIRKPCLLISALLAGLMWAGASATVAAGFDEDDADSEQHDLPATGLPTYRRAILALETFRESVAESRIEEAVDQFRRLQTSDPMYLVPSGDGPETYVPLYRAVFEAFYQLPATARDQVSVANSDVAQQLLMQAVVSADSQALPGLILRYAGTEASRTAHLILARIHHDRGHVLAAKTWLTSVRLADDVVGRHDAIDLLESLNAAESDPTGSSPNNEASVEGAIDTIPEQLKWQFRPAISQKLRQQIDTFHRLARESRNVPHATWADHLGQQTAYRRTLNGVAAIDLTTGKPRWQYALPPSLDTVLTRDRQNTAGFEAAAGNAEPDLSFGRLEQMLLTHTFFRDNVTGRPVGDEQRLYLVSSEHSALTSSTSRNIGVFGQRHVNVPFHGSRLIALEKSSGRRVWTVGRHTVERQLGGAPGVPWFAGAPAVAGRQLFSVFEFDGKIGLGCFESRTGELLWTAVLVFPDQTIDKDPIRRLWSATPTVAEGLIWCPTTAGWVVCVDQVTQSVLWASRVSDTTNDQERVSIRRGRPVVITQPASLIERWSVSGLHRTASRLVVTPHESREIILLDPATGQQLHRVQVGTSPMLLHLDDGVIVTLENQQLVCRSSINAERQWDRQLTLKDGFPTGEGVQRGDSLLLPMTTGAIAAIDLRTGTIRNSVEEVLPVSGWGYLTSLNPATPVNQSVANDDFTAAADADLLFVSPDRLSRISQSSSSGLARNPVELAAGLMAADKWQQALTLVNSVDDRDPDFTTAKSIAFECRLQLALKNPDVHLMELKRAATSTQEQVQVRVLETTILLQQQDFAAAAELLTDILALSPVELALLTPVTDRRVSFADQAESFVPGQPLQTWAATQLSNTLPLLSSTAAVVERMDQLEPSVLLAIQHPSVLPVIHRHIQKTDSVETAVQLLRHAIDIKLASASDSSPLKSFDAEAVSFAELVARVKTQPESGIRESGLLLLNVTALEMPAPFRDALEATPLFSATQESDRFQSREELQQAFGERLSQQFAEWTARSYSAVPIVRSLYGPAQNIITPVEADDLFLKQFHWSAVRGDYSRLLATRLGIADRSEWSVPGAFQFFGSFSNQQDVLTRLGSIVLLRTTRGISAISVLDQKVLWTKSFTTSTAVTMFGSATSINFDRFVPERHRLPSARSFSTVHPFGAGHRWLGLQTGRDILILDSWSGRTLWSARCPHSECRLYATDDAVIFRSRSDPLMMFDRRSGAPLSVEAMQDVAEVPICGFAELLVCWTPSDRKRGPGLLWLNPLTGAVVDQVSLAAMDRFHFVDDRTLAGFNSQGEMQIVDLKWRTSQTCSLAVTNDVATESEPVPEDENNGPPDDPFWNPSRLQVSVDSLNYYVSNRIGNRAKPLRVPSERQLTLFEGGLRVVDRETGQLRWSLRNDQVLMSTTDQPELPLLVLIDEESTPAPGQAYGRSHFRGLTKISGQEVFNQMVPSLHGLRNLTLTSPAPDTLDLAVQGLKIRLQGRPSE